MGRARAAVEDGVRGGLVSALVDDGVGGTLRHIAERGRSVAEGFDRFSEAFDALAVSD